MMSNVTILDTEFTSWEGAMERDWGGEGEYRELVQIGAIRVDPLTLDETDTLDIIVKPVRNPVLSDYFIGLTGITNERLAQDGVSFSTAIEKFRDFLKDGPLYSYGGDCMILNENIHLHGYDTKIAPFAGHNLHDWFADQGVETATVCSGELARHVGANFNPPAHDAVNDVRSITAAMRHLHAKGADLPF